MDEVLAAQRQQVAPVRALRGDGEAEEKLRLEVVDQPPVRGRRSVSKAASHALRDASGVPTL
jgi:hypothetical protein